ncbi:hypothetical protein [Streptomyces sp. TR02-1]|uniref:hypothetical protein n=1 Tax=Streptomyces sp. TR02-1 TaxID=3385977 RepID=UPI0039A18FE4
MALVNRRLASLDQTAMRDLMRDWTAAAREKVRLPGDIVPVETAGGYAAAVSGPVRVGEHWELTEDADGRLVAVHETGRRVVLASVASSSTQDEEA